MKNIIKGGSHFLFEPNLCVLSKPGPLGRETDMADKGLRSSSTLLTLSKGLNKDKGQRSTSCRAPPDVKTQELSDSRFFFA